MVEVAELMKRAAACTTKQDADQVLAEIMAALPGKLSHGDALRIVKENIGYWSGYYSREECKRMLRLFDTQHPIFGKRQDISITCALQAGMAFAKRRNENIPYNEACRLVRERVESGELDEQIPDELL